jgi:predicted DNA-binding transcriptional regulator YafY
LGVPIQLCATDVFEVEYGYVVPPDEYQLADPGLSDEERAALWLAAQVVRLGGQASGPGAILKLGGASQTAAGEPLAANLGTSEEDLGTIFSALSDRRRLQFTYTDKARRVDPYGLVHRNGRWYVVGRDRDADGVRAFRVDRIEALQPGEDINVFDRPEGFKASEAISEVPWEAGSEDIEAAIHFDPAVAWWARRQLTGTESVVETPDGGLEVTLRVANPDAFVGWVLAFEDAAEVMAPVELRSRLLDRVRGVA